MNIKKLAVFGLVLSTIAVTAQEKITGMRYFYEVTTPEQTEDEQEPLVCVLDIIENGSRFMSHVSFSGLQKHYEDATKENKPFNGGFNSTSGSDLDWYIYKKDNKIETISWEGFTVYKLNEAVKDIVWTLEPEVKNIADIEVQRATTTYGKRQWEVWFAPSIPIVDGPYKFSGLPGLVLEASDSEGQFSFVFTKSERADFDFWQPSRHEDAIAVNKKQLTKAKKVAENQTIGQMLGGNSTAKVTMIDSETGQPIELDPNTVKFPTSEKVYIERD